MRTITTDLYEALALWEADDTQWITEDTLHPGTFCLGPLEAMPEGQHWHIVCPEELAARRDALEDEQARLEEEHMQWQERRDR
jgi:hypothetical protein